MPFKTVTPAKKIAQVEGEVTGACYNKKLQTIAFVAQNPAQVALVSQDGKTSKVFGVQLKNTADIVLLNRDMAVIRSEDAAWSLLDIQHKALVDRIATDVKQLAGPQGESGVALRWDNQGEQLTPGKNEVANRTFQLRGEHRSIDVGETECYSVLDEGDGEFRVHPGATPEQGSATKCALPSGAKDLDRLRGGKFLSVIYQKNNPTVCLVRRAGNRLEPKLVTLGVPMADCAVSETSLIVVAKDGRAVLYDGDAISAAEGTIEPKAETPLGIRGEPRAFVVAHNTIWVGSATGDIVVAGLIRKQIMV